MPRFQSFQIEVDGRRYSATWHLEGKELFVSSAYGSRRAALGRARPELAAERLLRELLAERRA